MCPCGRFQSIRIELRFWTLVKMVSENLWVYEGEVMAEGVRLPIDACETKRLVSQAGIVVTWSRHSIR